MDIIKCHRCHRELPETHFYVNRSKKNGLHSWCKDCVRQYDHNKRLQHKKNLPILNNQLPAYNANTAPVDGCDLSHYSDQQLCDEIRKRGYSIVNGKLQKTIIQTLEL